MGSEMCIRDSIDIDYFISILLIFNLRSKHPVVDKSSPELQKTVLVHFWELEVVLVELVTDLVPESRFSRPQNLSNIGSVCSIVAYQVGIQFSRNWPCKSPIQEQGIEDSHSPEIEPR